MGRARPRVEGVDGTVEFELHAQPGDGIGNWQPWAEDDDRGLILQAGDLTLGLRCGDEITVDVSDAAATARFRVDGGDGWVLAVEASYREPLFLADVAAIDERIDLTTS